ncbi:MULTISPECIES: hypothetical protein [Maricaulis]|nr:MULTISPECIES: hypothetical protein [Maricaulis]MAC89612.1 hypothetical protein [Maricaulis sp.]
MINEFLAGVRQQVVADAMTAEFPETPYLRSTLHIAASLLQKSIRRGRQDLALQAAQRLFDAQPARFWRRLCITLFEDVGLLDRQLALDVLACAPRRGASKVSWTVVAYLVGRLCEATKTQVANNLLHLGLYDLHEAGPLEEFDLLSVDAAASWVTDGEASLVQQAKAVWQLSGISCAGLVLRHPQADRERALFLVSELAASPVLEIIARAGLRTTGHVLPLVSVLEASISSQRKGFDVVPDPMPEEEIIAGLPSWTFDQYTWPGKAALRRARTECPAIAADLSGRAGNADQRFRALADAHFEFESANLSLRAQIPAHIALWRRVQALGPHRHPETAQALYGALREDWEAFQTLRRLSEQSPNM